MSFKMRIAKYLLFSICFSAMCLSIDAGDIQWEAWRFSESLDKVIKSNFIKVSFDEKDPLNNSNVEWKVFITIYNSSYLDKEFGCVMVRYYDGLVLVRACYPKDLSFKKELIQLCEKYPDDSLDAILGKVNTKKVQLTSKGCPELIILADKFERLKIKLHYGRGSVLDSTYYFLTYSTTIGSAQLTMSFNDDDSTKGARRLVKWMQDVKKYIIGKSQE